MFIKKIILAIVVACIPFHYVHTVYDDSSHDLAVGITAVVGLIGIGFAVKWYSDSQASLVQKDAENIVTKLEHECLQCSKMYEHEYSLLSDKAATMVSIVQALPCAYSSYASYKNSVDVLQHLYDKAQRACSLVTHTLVKKDLQERLCVVSRSLEGHLKSVDLWQKTCDEHRVYQKVYDSMCAGGMSANYMCDSALYKEYCSGACTYERYADQVYMLICARASQQRTPFLCAVGLDMLHADYEYLKKSYDDLITSFFYVYLSSYTELAHTLYELLQVIKCEREIIAVHPQYRKDSQARLLAQQQQLIIDAAVQEAYARQELAQEQRKMNVLKEEELQVRSRELYELQRANDRRNDVAALQRKLDKAQRKLEYVQDSFKRDNRLVLKELKALDSELEYVKQQYGEAISASWLQSKLSSIRHLISDESDTIYNILIEIFVA